MIQFVLYIVQAPDALKGHVQFWSRSWLACYTGQRMRPICALYCQGAWHSERSRPVLSWSWRNWLACYTGKTMIQFVLCTLCVHDVLKGHIHFWDGVEAGLLHRPNNETNLCFVMSRRMMFWKVMSYFGLESKLASLLLKQRTPIPRLRFI